MKKIVFKAKKLFSAKRKIEIPKIFIEKCEGKRKKVAYMESNGDFIVLGSDSVKMSEMNSTISTLLGRNDTNGIIPITLHKARLEVPYKEIVGFFEFRGVVYYRAKGVAGRSIVDDLSFTNKIKEMYPDEFGNVISSQVGEIMVTPLIVL